jgi:trk system potassium uptake protein TrkA
VEEKIASGAHAIGQAIKDLPLPSNCIISGIFRDGEIVLPRGITTLQEGDEILAIIDDAARRQLEDILELPGRERS